MAYLLVLSICLSVCVFVCLSHKKKDNVIGINMLRLYLQYIHCVRFSDMFLLLVHLFASMLSVIPSASCWYQNTSGKLIFLHATMTVAHYIS